jgi:hypothetical protein
LKDAGVGAVWLSPIYKSPMADFGYDITNFTEIDPIFGTLDDFDTLKNRAKELGKVNNQVLLITYFSASLLALILHIISSILFLLYLHILSLHFRDFLSSFHLLQYFLLSIPPNMRQSSSRLFALIHFTYMSSHSLSFSSSSSSPPFQPYVLVPIFKTLTPTQLSFNIRISHSWTMLVAQV